MASLSVSDLFGVQGRVALVTGGCSGIGLMIAKVGQVDCRPVWVVAIQLTPVQGLVANGAKVYVTALPSDDIQGAVADLNKLGQASGGTAVG
jgi:NADP-dependent 3-hydroxy acid dehydrogenase YdfG